MLAGQTDNLNHLPCVAVLWLTRIHTLTQAEREREREAVTRAGKAEAGQPLHYHDAFTFLLFDNFIQLQKLVWGLE